MEQSIDLRDCPVCDQNPNNDNLESLGGPTIITFKPYEMLSAETTECCFHVIMGTDCPGETVVIRYACNAVEGIIGPNGTTVMDPDSFDTGIPEPLILCMPHGTEFSVEHWWCPGGTLMPQDPFMGWCTIFTTPCD